MNTKTDQEKPAKVRQKTVKAMLAEYGLDHTPTVSTLRKHGYKVTVNHYRRVSGLKRDETGNRVFPHYTVASEDLDPKGGATEVTIESPSGATATARQNCADSDPYCRRVGVAFAINKALKEAAMASAIAACEGID